MAENNKNNDLNLGIEKIDVGPGSVDQERYKLPKKKFGRTYINILHDPRVVRGNTYAAFVIPSSLQMEFLKLKEEEEYKKRSMKIPAKLPRVAGLSTKKQENIDDNLKSEEQTQPESPHLRPIENADEVIDKPYFYEDRPSTPKYIPLPAGIEVATQIEDGELFDFEIEVSPILQVLVGRSLLQAQYELIQADERMELLQHKIAYEQEREFELINLQRTEARDIRKEEERKRRSQQKVEKKQREVVIQKKLIAKIFSKQYLKNIKRTSLMTLVERGFLRNHPETTMKFYFDTSYLPVVDKLLLNSQQIRSMMKVFAQGNKRQLQEAHHKVVSAHLTKVNKEKEEKATNNRLEEENELRRIEEQKVRREQRRVKRIADSITNNILATKTIKADSTYLPMCDIDDLTFKSDHIHCLGGPFGEILIVLHHLLQTIQMPEDFDRDGFITKAVEEILLTVVRDALEIKYLESTKFDFADVPEDKKEEYHSFLIDEGKMLNVNKSLRLLLENDLIGKDLFTIVLGTLANIYFEQPAAPVDVDENNDDPEYQAKVKQEQEQVNEKNTRLELLKKKIKLAFIKGEVLKKKRDNIGGFIVVNPNEEVINFLEEVEEIPIEIVKEEILDEVQVTSGDEQVINKPNDDVTDDKPKTPIETIVEPESVVVPAQENELKNVESPIDPVIEAVPQVTINTIRLEYFDEAQIFKNSQVPIDSYVLHKKMTGAFQALLLRNIRRVLKKLFNVNFDLVVLRNSLNERYDSLCNFVIEHILTNEKYLAKSIVKIDVEHVTNTPIQVIDSQPPEDMNKNIQ